MKINYKTTEICPQDFVNDLELFNPLDAFKANHYETIQKKKSYGGNQNPAIFYTFSFLSI